MTQATSNKFQAAIMFTDISGFTKLMSDNEQNAKVLRDKHRKVITDAMNQFNGELIQHYGDGTLSIFECANDSVAAGIYIQKLLSDNPRVPLRIGIHKSAISRDAEGVYGDGVNLASRVESLGVPGSLLVSKAVFDIVKNNTDFELLSLGDFHFKNVDYPMDIYAVVNEPLVRPIKKELKGKTVEKHQSIAVLPFVNMSADPENEFFSDGITEEILNALTKIKGIQVTSRTSSFAYKGKNYDIRKIGEELGVDTLLEGSVRKFGNKVRITAQLIKASDGYHYWSENFDRELTDVFAVQDEISNKIASKLDDNFGEGDFNKKVDTVPTKNLECYSEYLQANYYWNKWTPESARKAISILEGVVEKDPDFAEAHSVMSACYVFLSVIGHEEPKPTFEKAKALSKRAIELKPESDLALANLGAVYFFSDYKWDLAEHFIQRALDLNPNNAQTYQYLAMLRVAQRNSEEAEIIMNKAVQLDPLSPVRLFYLAMAQLFQYKIDDAMINLNKALELDPAFRPATESIGVAHIYRKDYDKALETFQALQDFHQDKLKVQNGFGMVYGFSGQKDKAYECIRNLELRKQRDKHINLHMDHVLIYISLKEYDKALFHLDKVLEDRVGGLFISGGGIFTEFVETPEYAALMKKYGIPVR